MNLIPFQLGIEKPGFLPWINIVKAGLLSMNSSWKSSTFDCIWTSAVGHLGMDQVSNSRAFGNVSFKAKLGLHPPLDAGGNSVVAIQMARWACRCSSYQGIFYLVGPIGYTFHFIQGAISIYSICFKLL